MAESPSFWQRLMQQWCRGGHTMQSEQGRWVEEEEDEGEMNASLLHLPLPPKQPQMQHREVSAVQ